MATTFRFLEDAYLTEIDAVIVRSGSNGIVLDQTIFYPGVGISPADSGEIIFSDGRIAKISASAWDPETPDALVHIGIDPLPNRPTGEKVKARVSWRDRYQSMKAHSALHVVSIALPYPVVSGHIGDGHGYVTFEAESLHIPPKRLARMTQRLIDRRLAVDTAWIRKPLRDPRIQIRPFDWPGSGGLVRAVRIGNLDTRPCDGLHVRDTYEIGTVEITEISRRSTQLHDVHITIRDRNCAQLVM